MMESRSGVCVNQREKRQGRSEAATTGRNSVGERIAGQGGDTRVGKRAVKSAKMEASFGARSELHHGERLRRGDSVWIRMSRPMRQRGQGLCFETGCGASCGEGRTAESEQGEGVESSWRAESSCLRQEGLQSP